MIREIILAQAGVADPQGVVHSPTTLKQLVKDSRKKRIPLQHRTGNEVKVVGEILNVRYLNGKIEAVVEVNEEFANAEMWKKLQ